MRRLARSLLFATISLSPMAAAVPIPWKNCGSASDLLSISKSDASVWPPPVAAPIEATATLDASGQLLNLSIFLVHGVAWTFDSGPLPTTTNGGFVSLPASFPVTVTSPALPLSAGPYNTTHTFTGEGGATVTVVYAANLAAQLSPPLLTSVSIATGGVPGFPLRPTAGTAYQVRVQMTEQNGPEVFCMDITVPIKSALGPNVPGLVNVVSSTIPALSRLGLSILALLVAVCGVIVVRCRQGGPLE